MTDAFTRRDFLASSAGAVAAAALPVTLPRPGFGAPAVILRGPASPVAISSANSLLPVSKAMELLLQGADTLDAAVEGVKIQELDPNDQSVGYGGLPNEEGVVQLDASCVHGPTRRAGAVACLEGIKTPSEVAKLVLKYTTHMMLVGQDAKRFALSFGFKEEDLLTPASRAAWLEWRANRGHEDDWVDVGNGEGQKMLHRVTGTINLDVVAPSGDLSSVTTTSGLAYKIPGRVGDSPIIGAGQYTDNTVGSAGSTGLGEMNIMACGGFLTVDHMRRGMKPTDACLETLRRVLALTPPRLLAPDGSPRYQLNYYAVNKRGEYGSAAFYQSRFAVHDGREAAFKDCATLYQRPAP
ncbi:MAG TPA: N(4)-(beta-N-acetylglucosaminyl)-L-asparaginase [Gemmatimonadales bacterium]|nr:N(4)-(beta-N-acetylglucosaminyl)-L-asparaginase [Gemmatimonadales bacterium]